MRPVIFSFGPLTVYSYGLMVALAILLGIFWVGNRAKKEGLADFDQITDLAIHILLGGIIGARIVYVLTDLPQYLRDPFSVFYLTSGGLSFYGGVLGAFALGYRYARRAGLPIWKLADVIALYIPLGYSVARIGCFLRGCCYGVPSHLPWALACAAEDDLPRHPTQIYAIIANLLIFLILRRYRKHRYFSGFLFWLYLELYAITRFVIEIFRDSQILAFGWLRTTQAACILIAVGVFFYIRRRLKEIREINDERAQIKG